MLRTRLLSAARAAGRMRVLNAAALLWFASVKRVAGWLGADALPLIYNSRYFNAETNMTLPTAPAVVDILIDEFRPRTVADVGCGTAVYLREFQRRGVEIWGCDGSEVARQNALIPQELIEVRNLTQPLAVARRFDLVTCFEVAEHIPAAFADAVVENIVSLGNVVAFSAAHPGQGGVDHVNEQTGAYWIARFENRGYRYRDDRTKRLRSLLKERSCVWWLVDNILVFEAAS
ncbi:MAG: class I SAM-dependent methyltransferase [Pirellulales bacterium]